MSQYRRIIIDDSSSDDDTDNNNNEFLDETPCDNSEDDENSDINVQNVSRLLETLSFTKRNAYGHRVDGTDDEASSIDEDTYLEDSFLVKDYTSSEENFSNISDDEHSLKKGRSICTYNREIARKKTNKKTTETSSFLKSDRSDISTDNDKVSTLFELYPELKENLNLEGNQVSNDGLEIHNKSTESDVDSDDKFEKYLKKVKTQSSVTKTYEPRDLDRFIMSDSESIIECSSECDSDSSDKSSHGVLKNIGDGKIRHHSTPKNISNEHAAHWHHPVTARKMKQNEQANLILGSRSALNIQKEHHQDDDEVFLLALSPNGPVHANAQKYIATKFPRIRKELTAKLFDLYRRRCFKNKLDSNMVLEWNTRLRLTAGRCRCKSNGTASIELSVKVCDTPERLRDALLHELCHAAVWVIDHIHNGGHGPAWKYWAYQCQKIFPSLPLIKRCHNYIIDAKYLYICDRCGQTIKRHSKSLDTDRKICGICQGRFILRSRDGKEFSTKPANTFAQFVKENYRSERKPGVKHAEIMKILSLRYKEEKTMASETERIIAVG
uniref:SprT-like domain-containing protein n=1 Tax=Onchocerca volvulus TaxID=6282 RepID=A0A8R1XTL1_ONCVO